MIDNNNQVDRAEGAPQPVTNNSETPLFSIDKIYVKDISVEVPHAPAIFLETEQPNVEMNLSFDTQKLDAQEDTYQVVLTTKVTANIKTKSQTLFIVELQTAGIFRIKNFKDADLDLIKQIECPSILFPYARQRLSQLISDAGFMPIYITPINFNALYLQKKQNEQRTTPTVQA